MSFYCKVSGLKRCHAILNGEIHLEDDYRELRRSNINHKRGNRRDWFRSDESLQSNGAEICKTYGSSLKTGKYCKRSNAMIISQEAPGTVSRIQPNMHNELPSPPTEERL